VLKGFGERLRGLREGQSLAQEGLAEVANVHRNEIGVLERGQCELGLLTLLSLVDTLKVAPGALLDGLPVPGESRPQGNFRPHGWG
jgi:transcriptional regulator with XRE-family HTH domain